MACQPAGGQTLISRKACPGGGRDTSPQSRQAPCARRFATRRKLVLWAHERIMGLAMATFIGYPAANHEQAEGLAAANADRRHWTVLTAEWYPNGRGDGGVLVLQVEDGEA